MGVFHFKKFDVCDDRSAMKVGTDGVLLGSATEVSMNITSGCASEINAEIRSFDRPDGHQGRPCKYIGAAALTIVLFVLFVRNMFVCRSTNSTNFTVTRHPLLINKSFLRLAEYRFICVSRTERGLYPFTRIMSQC